MTTNEIVTGQATKHTNDIYLSWEDPQTGEEMWAQGEFSYNTNKDSIIHSVFDENGNIKYTVEAVV